VRNEIKAAIVTAVLIMGIAIFFRSVLDIPQDVVPLFLVPALLYAGYAVAPAGFKTWLVVTLFISIAMAVLYAVP
jgi:hypothetical protein